MNKNPSYILIKLGQVEALRRLLIQVQQRIDEILEEDCPAVKVKQSLFDDGPAGEMSHLKLDEMF
jgi:hypothetical protein